MKDITMCKDFITKLFEKHCANIKDLGIEINLFWRLAEESGLHTPGTYGGPMSKALEEMCSVRTRNDDEGNFILSAFVLNK